MLRKFLASAFAVAAAAALATPAEATPTESAYLVLTVSGSQGPTRAGTLRCGPNGGIHHSPDAACAALTQVDGDFDQLNVAPDRACTLQYDPVHVTAFGRWRGKRIDFATTYGNPCVLVVTTGPVFRV
ncbi:Protease inhibitor, SSI family (subtilisin inhibitor) [Alloactinosynnema sp. L-07]|uniref:SSI family serine proteinase inhibitor n=1 Tax=Alloactinosynnema sp. L-07 TaxID=1653480 RepID=UPI00065F0AAC|nr:SSI family serine proteinase inhibitor [Alloactinosynnema sp. L-07]CRK56247.1 Protease inhibitor, SSI family (subtilisin inhibitor) [Alloactinosynnema sp. L-07]